MNQEDVVLRFLQVTFTLLLVVAVIVDRERIVDNIASFKNKIYRLRHKKEIALIEQNNKKLYNYIFYVILPKLARNQFIQVCSNKFKYNNNVYELYFEKQQDGMDFYYQITLRKVIGINRYISPLQAILTNTNTKLIFLFRFKRIGPENIYVGLEKSYKNNLNIILTALMLIHSHPKANNNSYYPEFKGDREIYEE